MYSRMFRLFENTLNPTGKPAESEPPASLVAFYWHFARQAKGLFVALFVTGFIVAVLDSAIPAFIGRIVTLVTSSRPEALWAGFAVTALLSRPRSPHVIGVRNT